MTPTRFHCEDENGRVRYLDLTEENLHYFLNAVADERECVVIFDTGTRFPVTKRGIHNILVTHLATYNGPKEAARDYSKGTLFGGMSESDDDNLDGKSKAAGRD